MFYIHLRASPYGVPTRFETHVLLLLLLLYIGLRRARYDGGAVQEVVIYAPYT